MYSAWQTQGGALILSLRAAGFVYGVDKHTDGWGKKVRIVCECHVRFEDSSVITLH